MFKSAGISWTFYPRSIVRRNHVIVMKVAENQYSVFGHALTTFNEQVRAINMFIKKEQEREKMKANARNN